MSREGEKDSKERDWGGREGGRERLKERETEREKGMSRERARD